MRSTILLLVGVLTSGEALAQPRAWTFNAYGPSRVQLAGLYRPALGGDSAVFAERDEEFIAAWQQFMTMLGTSLKENGFTWGAPTRCMALVYFDACGSVDRFLYSFREGTLDPAKAERFGILLNAFLEQHVFPLKAMEPFSQCGPLVFHDAP
ncbi:MAG: hypothetical protein JNM31_10260 [Flavobacteriales bacterium]|nr:hypothetical protein [Flavobacteriales bacterium]